MNSVFGCVFFTLTDRASNTLSNIYVVTNLVRDLLGRKISEEHLSTKLQREYENPNQETRTKQKQQGCGGPYPLSCLLLARAILQTGVSYCLDNVEDIYDDGGPLCLYFNP